MRLPFLISLPHAGTDIPEELIDSNLLTQQEIIEDGDEGAKEIYTPLQSHVEGFITSSIARAFIDLNRAENDFSQDGVIKTHTCWNIPIYTKQPDQQLQQILLEKYYIPYHQQINQAIASNSYQFAIDCHTMASTAPPIAQDAGTIRPMVCLSDCNGLSFPQDWLRIIADSLQEELGSHFDVMINKPFTGGYTLRKYYPKLFYLQIEFSRSNVCSYEEKSQALLKTLYRFNQKNNK